MMAIQKITKQEVDAINVQAAPDTLEGDVQENKAIFDNYPNLIKDRYNSMADEIGYDAAAESELEDIFRAKGMSL